MKHEEVLVHVAPSGTRTLVSGMLGWLKVAHVCFVIVPKAAIACTLYYVGSLFILTSEDDETVLLNTVALYFILDVDEYIFSVFTSSFTKNALNKIPPIIVKDSDLGFWLTCCSMILGNWAALGLIFGVSYGMYSRCG